MKGFRVSSATGMVAFFFMAAVKLQTFLFYETTHAFSPSLPVAVLYSPPACSSPHHPTRTYPHLSRLKMTIEDNASPGGQTNHTTESQQHPIRYDASLVRFRCRVSYDGTSFAGFQLQGGRTESKAKPKPNPKTADTTAGHSSSMTKEQHQQQIKQKRKTHKSKQNNNPRTIQGELETVLSQRFQRLVKVVGAGRTDGGVHARGQAIHFDLYPNETNGGSGSDDDASFEQTLETSLNRMLPSDIRAWNVGRASPDLVAEPGSNHTLPGWYNWNAMRSCTGKLYSYRISVGDSMHPCERHHRWQLPWQGVNPLELERILRHFEGEHDFVCFAGALEQQEKKTGIALGTVRRIHKIKLVQEAANTAHLGGDGDPSHDCYRIDIYLDGALYKMVRNIVGTAIDVSRGWLDEESLLDLLERPSELNYSRKNNPCKPAPSNGLTLERVFYPDEF